MDGMRRINVVYTSFFRQSCSQVTSYPHLTVYRGKCTCSLHEVMLTKKVVGANPVKQWFSTLVFGVPRVTLLRWGRVLHRLPNMLHVPQMRSYGRRAMSKFTTYLSTIIPLFLSFVVKSSSKHIISFQRNVLWTCYVQSWTIETGTEPIDSYSFFSDVCSSPRVKFVSVGSRLRCLSSNRNPIRFNDRVLVKIELGSIYPVPM